MIHPSTIIEDGAEIAEDVEVGPFCHIGPSVRLESGVKLLSHVVISGHTRIGAKTRIFPFASLGHEAQDLKYSGEYAELRIGSDCIIREGVTMNPGTSGGRSLTSIGNHCTFLAHSHVAHDCMVGDRVILSNNVMLGGHTIIENRVIIGGGVGVHQFCRIGKHAFIGALTLVVNDVIPFGMAIGNRARLEGLNLVGMKRAGLAHTIIHQARNAYKVLWSNEGLVIEQTEKIVRQFPDNEVVRQIVAFIKGDSIRSLCTPRSD